MTMATADRIDLLPGFVAARRRARRLLGASTFVACAAGGAVALAFIAQSMTLANAQGELDVQRAENAAISAQVAELSDLEVLQARLVTQQLALSELFKDEVRWSTVLADLQAVVPSDTWLTGMSVSQVTPEAGADGSLVESEFVARIEFQGTTFSHPDVADWLQRLDRVPGFDEPYVTMSTKTDVEGREVVSFSSSVMVTKDALRSAQPGGDRIR